MELLECIQKKAAKMVKGLDPLYYKKSLSQQGLFSTEVRQLRWDLTEVYKHQKGGC